jgi:hypothetical protein
MKVIVTINTKVEFGLEIWQVKVNGTLLGVHMSEAGARTAAKRFENGLAKAAA